MCAGRVEVGGAERPFRALERRGEHVFKQVFRHGNRHLRSRGSSQVNVPSAGRARQVRRFSLGRHVSVSAPASCRCSQVRAKVQSRSALRRLTPRACAASSTASPAKTRSFTSAAAWASISASRASAASSSMRSSGGASSRSTVSRSRVCLSRAAALEAFAVSSPVDQDAPHRLGGGGEEVAAAVPPRGVAGTDEPEVGLVDERSRLVRVAWLLDGEPVLGNPAQLFIDEREQSPCRLRIALLDRREDACDVIHHRRLPGRMDASSPLPSIVGAGPHCRRDAVTRSVCQNNRALEAGKGNGVFPGSDIGALPSQRVHRNPGGAGDRAVHEKNTGWYGRPRLNHAAARPFPNGAR